MIMQTYIPQSKTFLKQTNKTDKQIASLTFEFYMISLFFCTTWYVFQKRRPKNYIHIKYFFVQTKLKIVGCELRQNGCLIWGRFHNKFVTSLNSQGKSLSLYVFSLNFLFVSVMLVFPKYINLTWGKTAEPCTSFFVQARIICTWTKITLKSTPRHRK